jgi:tRNA pseudouridine55 synthase
VPPIDGVIVFDKPAGVTSHDIVARVRRAHGRTVKVGHAGTLDPFATGLLLVLVGRATRAQQWLMGLDKEYETVARLGWTSTTGDPEGETVHTGRVPADPPALPTGTIRQRPPIHSAVHVDGERAYKRARRGEDVEIPEREVHVARFVQDWRDGERAGFSIGCSTGTYVRSLIMALDDAYCLELRRTAIGPFRVEDADAERIVPLADALGEVMPVVAVDEDEARLLATGRRIADPRPDVEGPVLAVDGAGPIAVTQRDDGGLRRPVVGFRG